MTDVNFLAPIFCDAQEYERCWDTSMSSFVIMASRDSKDIQISLHTSLSALSVCKDVGIPDDTSSINSSFTAPSYSPRNSPAPTENGFTLHLAKVFRKSNSLSLRSLRGYTPPPPPPPHEPVIQSPLITTLHSELSSNDDLRFRHRRIAPTVPSSVFTRRLSSVVLSAPFCDCVRIPFDLL